MLEIDPDACFWDFTLCDGPELVFLRHYRGERRLGRVTGFWPPGPGRVSGQSHLFSTAV